MSDSHSTGMLFELYCVQCFIGRANCNAVGIHSKNSMMKKVIPIILIMCVAADCMKKKQMSFAVAVI
jgi:folate-dependent tRNA-U54 methylase TrmFO/GidA